MPVGDFNKKYRDYAEQVFKKLLRAQEDGLSEDQRTWLTTNESAITERIDRFLETGHHERIWPNWDRGSERFACSDMYSVTPPTMSSRPVSSIRHKSSTKLAT